MDLYVEHHTQKPTSEVLIIWSRNYTCRTAYFGTYKCFGPGSNTSTWPAWTRQLSKKQAKPFLNIATFIDADEWLPTPIPPTLT